MYTYAILSLNLTAFAYPSNLTMSVHCHTKLCTLYLFIAYSVPQDFFKPLTIFFLPFSAFFPTFLLFIKRSTYLLFFLASLPIPPLSLLSFF